MHRKIKPHIVRKPAVVIAAGLTTASILAVPAYALAATNPTALIHSESGSTEAAHTTYGTDYTDNIQLNGYAYVAGDWTATVQYNSALVEASTDNGLPSESVPGETEGSTASGVDSDFATAGYQVYDSVTETWTAADDNGRANDGMVDLLYSTVKGPWIDGASIDGDDAPDGGGQTRLAGTYLLTVPTAIKYANMHVGAVDTSDDYTINVQGVLPAGYVVKIWAESGKVLDGPTDSGSKITETTSMKSPNTSVNSQLGNTGGEYSGGADAAYSKDDNYRIITASEAWNENESDEAGQSAITGAGFTDIDTSDLSDADSN